MQTPALSAGALPLTLLTGFLGSGKTTLLARLLAQPEMAGTAVILNEFSEACIDHLIVGPAAGTVVALGNGCLCCTIRGDLALTLHDLLYRREHGEVAPFRRVIVETSGVADPVPLAHLLMETASLKKLVVLEDIVTVVDTLHGVATVPMHEAAADQVAMADLILLSKVDLATPAQLAHTRQLVAAINPGAEVIERMDDGMLPGLVVGQGRFTPGSRADVMANWLMRHAEHHPGEAHPHDHGLMYTSHVLRHPEPLGLAGTLEFLDRTVAELGSRLLRIKGIAGFREKHGLPAVLNAVQRERCPLQWMDAWPDQDHESRIVFIGRQLDVEDLERQFRASCC